LSQPCAKITPALAATQSVPLDPHAAQSANVMVRRCESKRNQWDRLCGPEMQVPTQRFSEMALFQENRPNKKHNRPSFDHILKTKSCIWGTECLCQIA
jgi:hypothetical protein